MSPTVSPNRAKLHHIKQWLSDPSEPTSINSKQLHKLSFAKALKLFHRASELVPAYKDFLRQHQINPSSIKTLKDFQQVPCTTKANYIEAYPLSQRCMNGTLAGNHMISSSSGSTGKPHFWPRHLMTEMEGASIHERIFENIFNISKKRSLFVNCFSLGNWIAGTYTHACTYLLAMKGYDFTIATPGLSEEEALKILENIAPFYEQTIVAGHPPTLKMFMENGAQKGIDWKSLNLKFIGAGEGISEQWRDYLIDLVQQTDPHTTFINILGSADAGLMAHETPLSIQLRRLLHNNPSLSQKIFDSDRPPFLYQFDPMSRYIESVQQEITITADIGMPLIRYNIHDRGGVMLYDELLNKFDDDHRQSLLREANQWRLPFAYMFGRSTFVATIYSVNIYPENIKSVLDHKLFQPHVTGRFILKTEFSDNHDQYLLLRIETRPDAVIEDQTRAEFVRHCIQILKQLNSEFNKLEQVIGEKAHPKIEFHPYGDNQHFPINKVMKSS